MSETDDKATPQEESTEQPGRADAGDEPAVQSEDGPPASKEEATEKVDQVPPASKEEATEPTEPQEEAPAGKQNSTEKQKGPKAPASASVQNKMEKARTERSKSKDSQKEKSQRSEKKGSAHKKEEKRKKGSKREQGTSTERSKKEQTAQPPSTTPASSPAKKSSSAAADAQVLWKVRPTKIPKAAPPAKEEEIEVKEPVPWRRFSVLASAIIWIALGAHMAGLFGGEVFNDQYFLQPVKAMEDSQRFWAELIANGLQHPLSQPWMRASFAWDFRSAGTSAVWFHSVNLGLHIATSLYLFFLLFRLGRYWKAEGKQVVDPVYLAFGAAALFACHPLAAEPVAYISARGAPLVGANYFLALNFFLWAFLARGMFSMLGLYAVSFVFAAMALFSGLEALTLPFSMLVLALLLKPLSMTMKEWAQARYPDLVLIGGACIGVPFLAALGANVYLNDGLGLPTPSTFEYLASQFNGVVSYYLRCFLVPIGLSVEPPLVGASGIGDVLAALGVVCVVAAIYLAWKFRNNPAVAFGVFLALANLIPAGSFVQPEMTSDARFYMSLAGLCTIVGWVFARYLDYSRLRAIAAAVVVFVAFCGLSEWRALAWASDQSLWKETLRTNPQSARAHAMLALDLLRQSKTADARKEAEEALRIDANSVLGREALGIVKVQENDLQSAAMELSEAVDEARSQKVANYVLADCQIALADAYLRLGMPAKAKPLVEQARTVQPGNPKMHLLLGKCWLEDGQPFLAFMELRKGMAKDPSNIDFYEPLAQSLLDNKLPQLLGQAYDFAQRAVMLKPTAKAFNIIARAALETERLDEAENWLKNSLKKNPNDAEALYLMSILMKDKHKDAEAADYKKQAVAINPKIESKVPVLPLAELRKLRLREAAQDASSRKEEVAEPPPPADEGSQSSAKPNGGTPQGSPAQGTKPQGATDAPAVEPAPAQGGGSPKR
ncbi:MAG TPA: tetratricopeptide repeat protein [Candidatus Obscuribacterales bacterium]